MFRLRVHSQMVNLFNRGKINFFLFLRYVCKTNFQTVEYIIDITLNNGKLYAFCKSEKLPFKLKIPWVGKFSLVQFIRQTWLVYATIRFDRFDIVQSKYC